MPKKTKSDKQLSEKIERGLYPLGTYQKSGKNTTPQLDKANMDESTFEERMPDLSRTASSMECTGLMPSLPLDQEEFASYQELYNMEIPKKNDPTQL